MAQRLPGQVPPYYAWLGVSPDVSATALMKRYRQLSLQLHPDRAAYRDAPDKEHEVQRRFQHITEAYNVLSDPALRAAYDTRHSVNFRGRASAVQQAIRQHNDQTTHRTTTTARGQDERDDVDTVPSSASPSAADVDASLSAKRTRSTDAEDKEDDDDDYDPHPTRSGGLSCSATLRGGDDGGKAAAIASQPLHRLFSLHRRHVAGQGDRRPRCTAATSSSPSLQQQQQQHWRTVVVTRPSLQDSWGLLLHRNLLLGCDAMAPFPARIIQVNSDDVRASSDVATMLATDQSNVLELTLWLTYAVAEYELADHHDLLRDATVLGRLVPRTPGAPAILAEQLLPDACVVSVNGVSVMDAAELHDELRICADAHETTIVLGCATLDGLPRDGGEL